MPEHKVKRIKNDVTGDEAPHFGGCTFVVPKNQNQLDDHNANFSWGPRFRHELRKGMMLKGSKPPIGFVFGFIAGRGYIMHKSEIEERP